MGLAVEAPDYDVNFKRDMQRVQQDKGVTLLKQISDFMHLRKLKSGLTMQEYLSFELYDKKRSEYNSYMGDLRARSAFYTANKLTSWDAASDKYFYHALVTAANLPTPKLIALAHKNRNASGAEALRTQEDIKAFLESCELPLFGKPVHGTHGDGAINIISRKADIITTNLGETFAVKELVKQIAAHLDTEGYIFQSTLIAHPEIAKITNNRVATARILVFVGPDGPFVRDSVLRMPAGENTVDNFRRPGNLLAGINLETGELNEAIRGVGLSQERLSNHPDTGEKIAGKIVPDFEAAKELTCNASSIYPDLHIQSWDVAFTPEGPVLLELNPGGNFNIFQFANGRGLFDKDFRQFVEWCVNHNVSASSNKKTLMEAKKLLSIS